MRKLTGPAIISDISPPQPPPRTPPGPEPLQPPDPVGEWAGAGGPKSGNRKKGPPKVAKKPWERALDSAQFRIRTGEWSDATARELVAAYALLFERVYGVAPALAPKERAVASFSAKRFLDAEFGGDRDELSVYLKWVWTRELNREKWRRSQPVQRAQGGLHWRVVFGAAVNDWRVDAARRRAGGAR